MPQYSLEELLARLRATDPDYYEDKTDDELQQYLFTQFPKYRKQVIPEELPEQYPVVSNEELAGLDVINAYDPGVGDMLENTAKGFTSLAITTGNWVDGTLNAIMDIAESANAAGTHTRRETLARLQIEDPTNPLLLKELASREIAGKAASDNFERRTLATNARWDVYYDKLDAWSKEEDQAAYENWMAETPYSFSQMNIDMVLRGVSELAPSVVASVGAGMVGGPVGAAAMMFGMEAGGARHEAMEYLLAKGVDPVEAAHVSDEVGLVYGGIAAPIEYFALGKMMRYLGLGKVGGKIFGKKLADKILANRARATALNIPVNFAKSELVQVAQEGLQNMAQLMVEKSYKVYGQDKGLDYRQSYEHFWDDFSEAYRDPSTGQAMWSAGMGMLPGQSLATAREIGSAVGGLREGEEGKPTYDSRDKKFNLQEKAQAMFDEVKGRWIKDKDGNIMPGIEDDDVTDFDEQLRRETLSDSALTLRRYTARIEDLSQEELERGEELEIELGGDNFNDPKVKTNWANEIADIAENAPEAFNEANVKKDDIMPLLQDPDIVKSHPDLAPKVESLIAPTPEAEAPVSAQTRPGTQPDGVWQKPKDFDTYFTNKPQAKFEEALRGKQTSEDFRQMGMEDAQVSEVFKAYRTGALALPKGVTMKAVSEAEESFRKSIEDAAREGKGEDEPKGPAGGVPPTTPPQAPPPDVDTGTTVNIPKGTGIKVGGKEPISKPPASTKLQKWATWEQEKILGKGLGAELGLEDPSVQNANKTRWEGLVDDPAKILDADIVAVKKALKEKPNHPALLSRQKRLIDIKNSFSPGKQGELDLDTSTKILPVVPTMPETNEEKRTMSVEAAAELLELKKMEGVTIQRGIAPRLGGIGVADRVQGQGIGTRFFNAKAKEFLSRGKTYMEIPVRPGSEGFWTKMGFKKVGVSETAIKHEGKEIFPDLMGRDLVPRVTAEKGIPQAAFDALRDQMRIAGIDDEDIQAVLGNGDPSFMPPEFQLKAYNRMIELADSRGKGQAIRDAITFEPEYQEFLDKQSDRDKKTGQIDDAIQEQDDAFREGPALTTVQVFKGVGAVREAERQGLGINVLRKEGNKHYGNPFTSKKSRTRAEVQVATIEESINRFEGWLRGTADQTLQPERRKWIIEQIDNGVLTGKKLLYHANLPKSHASVLADFVNERTIEIEMDNQEADAHPFSGSLDEYSEQNDEYATAYLDIPNRVSFPPSDDISDIHAIVDGKRVELTEEQKDRLIKIGADKGSMVKFVQGAAEADLYKLGQELIDDADKIITVEDLNVPEKPPVIKNDIIGPAPKEMPEGITYSDDGALVVKISGMTKVKNQMFIPGVTEAMVNLWQAGELIQRAMPDLTADQREFMIDGVTAAEWEAAYPEENDFGIEDLRDGDTAMALLKDDPANFMLWVSDVPKLQTLEALMDRLKDNPEFMQSLGEDAAKITKALVDEIALRYQRGGQDIVSKMSVFNDGSKKVKKIEFKTNKRAILSNASKDLLGNYPAKVMINELLQNSFDAKATVLEVDIFADSYDSDIDLRFEDNGSGMSPDEVETNLFVFGNRSKGEYDAGSYGQAKAAFMLFPKKFKLTTVKDGVKTVAEGTSDDLLDGHVEIVSTRTTKANGTKFEFLLDATGSNPGKDRYYEALEEQMGKIHRPLRAYVRKFGQSLNESGLKSTDKKFIHLAPHTKYGQMYEGYKLILNELTSAPKRETVHPTLNLDYKGNEIEITFEKRTPYGWKSGYGYGVTNHTLNKGLPLPELTDRFTANLEYNKPNFAIIVDFKKTPLVDSPNYPFIRNRSQYNDDIKKFIQTEIKQVLNAENRHALDLNVKELQEAIDTAPTYGGVKIVLPELVTAKDKLMVHELLATQQAFLSRIGEVFAEYNRMLKEAGYKTIDLVITVDPSTHGWRPNVEDFGGKEVYAINPFALEDDGIERFVTNLINPHPHIDSLNHRITNLQEMQSHLNPGNLHNFNIIDRSPQVSAVRLTQEQYRDIYGQDMPSSGPYHPTDLSVADLRDVISSKLKLIKDDIDNWNVTETKKLIKEKGPQWRSEIMAHALVHEFAHNWGTGHDAKHASKILEIYMLVGHDNMAKLKNQLLELFNSTGANYENIQKALKEIYRKVDKRAVGFREELAVGGLPESSGKDGRAENSNPLTGEISGAVKDIIAHTGKWHQLRRIYQEAWLRVQEIHAELHGDLGQKVAINKYIRLMQDKLPFWAVDSFRDWYVDAFPDKQKEDVWSDLDKGETLDYFLDDYETDKVIDSLLSEMREGLEESGDETLDLRYLTKLNAVINVSLGIALPLKVQGEWHSEVHNYDTADKWIDGTLEKYTQIPLERLTPGKRDKLKLKYHSLKNTIRTNRADQSLNQRHNMIVEMSKDGDISFQMRTNKNVMTRKENPQYDRNFVGGEDLNLSWLNLRDVLESTSHTDQLGKTVRTVSSRYSVLDEADLQIFDAKLLLDNKVIAFIRGETALAIADITKEHYDLAVDKAALLRFWELEGLTESQIKNVTAQLSIQWRASQIAAYQAVKRHYPEFMNDDLPNVYKRLKIPFTPAIKLNGFREVTVKVVNKEKLSFVHPDGTEVKAWQKIKDMDSLYAGDGGTYASGKFFDSMYDFLGINKNSKKSKNVIAQRDQNGTFFVKHLMYQPIVPDKGTGTIRIYENYGKDNEKIIGEIRDDGNMYGSPIPKTWTKSRVDRFITEHKIASKDANELIDFFTNDAGHGIPGMVTVANRILDDIDGIDNNTFSSLHEKLEFIVSKEDLLKDLVRKIAYQTEVGMAEIANPEAFDLLMTNDEMKVGTKVYEQMQKTGQTFEIDGASIGVLTSTDDQHSYAPYPDQLGNHIRDPHLRQLFRDYLLPSIKDKIETVFRMARDPIKLIAKFTEYLRRGPFNAIDNITADFFELGGGMHPSGVGVVEAAVMSRRIRPAQRMEKMPGMTEDIEWDLTGELLEEEASVSAKNASIVYSAIAEDPYFEDAETSKEARQLPLNTVNEWLSANEIWVLGYRAPTPHVNGAAMMRIRSIHATADIVYLNPNTIFRGFEGDGDGDHFFMVKLPDPVTRAYRAHYSRASIRAKIKGVNLKALAKGHERSYDFTNPADRYNLMSALMEGKKAIAEIAKTQRTYGQLLDVFDHIVVSERGIETKVKLVQPEALANTSEFNSKNEYTLEEKLRVYVQAAVDNGKYMLLRKWNYSSEQLRRSLFIQENGQPITETQWAAVKPLIRLQGKTGELRGGKDFNEGIFDFTTQIKYSTAFLEYMEDRQSTYFAELAAQSHFVVDDSLDSGGYYINPTVTKIAFTGETSVQEELVTQVALLNRHWERSGDEGSPFRLSPLLHNMAHDEAVHLIQEDKWDIGPVSQADLNAGYHYANNMFSAFGNMWEDFKVRDMDPGFLGWSTNENMVNFAEKWDKKFKELSLESQQIATYRFLEGVYKSYGKIRFIRQLPPISGRATGITTLNPEIMKRYLKEYNKVLQSKENRHAPTIRENTGFIEFEVEAHKKGCK